MANFIQNKYNSMPEQVEENKKNIKELIEIYTDYRAKYRATVDLSDNSVTVLRSDTNVPLDINDGWLLSQDGYFYKITGGDNTNLLIEFYAQFKGDKGDKGDNGTNVPVIANVIIAPTDIDLETLQIGDDKYHVGKSIYYHPISMDIKNKIYNKDTRVTFAIINNDSNAFTDFDNVIAVVRSWGLAQATINCSGCINSVGSLGNRTIVVSSILISSSKVYFLGTDLSSGSTSGVEQGDYNATNFEVTYFNDDVNLIN